jgi:hypothetical protein
MVRWMNRDPIHMNAIAALAPAGLLPSFPHFAVHPKDGLVNKLWRFTSIHPSQPSAFQHSPMCPRTTFLGAIFMRNAQNGRSGKRTASANYFGAMVNQHSFNEWLILFHLYQWAKCQLPDSISVYGHQVKHRIYSRRRRRRPAYSQSWELTVRSASFFASDKFQRASLRTHLTPALLNKIVKKYLKGDKHSYAWR